MTICRQVFFTGRVQGVGFRYTVKQVATGYEVTGWVRNLPDGRVEMQVCGVSSEIEAFFHAIAGSQLSGFITETRQTDAPPPAVAWTNFEIRA